MYFSSTWENVRNNEKGLLNNNIILNKLMKSSAKCNPKRVNFLSLSILGIVKAGRNTFYKYEYKYKICLSYMIQTGFYK